MATGVGPGGGAVGPGGEPVGPGISGAVSVTPAAAVARAAALVGAVVLGALSLTPAVAPAKAAAVAPTVSITGGNITPAAAAAKAAAVAPTTILGSLTLTPSAAPAKAVAVAPTVDISAGVITPAAATAKGAAVAPTVIKGSLSLTPSRAEASAAAVAPTVSISEPPSSSSGSAMVGGAGGAVGPAGGAVGPGDDAGTSIVVTPPHAPARARAIAPTVDITGGSVTITPAVADARAIALVGSVTGGEPDTGGAFEFGESEVGETDTFGGEASADVTLIPEAAIAKAAAIAPATTLSSHAATPSAATARGRAVAPATILGSVSLTPSAAEAAAVAVAPIVAVGDGNSQTIAPDPAIARARAVAPTTLQGALELVPAAAIVRGVGIDPTVTAGAITLTPLTASARARTVAPAVLAPVTLTPPIATSRARAVLGFAMGGEPEVNGAPLGYASYGVDTFDRPYVARILNEIVVERTVTDPLWGAIAVQDVTVELANLDGALTAGYLAGLEGKPLVIKRYDRASGVTITEWTGQVSRATLEVDRLVLEGTNLDPAFLDDQVPDPTVDTATFPLAVDVGATIPVVFGQGALVPGLWVLDDKANSRFHCLFGHGALSITGLRYPGVQPNTTYDVKFSECERAAGGPATSWAEVARTDLYAGYTVVSFIKRQQDYSNGLVKMNAFVNGLQPERNFARAIRSLVSNPVWGAGQPIDAASFDAAEAALPPNLFCDGAMTRPLQVRDWLKQLLMVYGMRLGTNALGQRTLTVDGPRNVTFPTAQDPGTLLAIGGRKKPTASERVRQLVVRYRLDPLTGRYLFPAKRTLQPTGVKQKVTNDFIRVHETADRVADNLGKRIFFGQETVDVELTQEYRALVEGGLVPIAYPRMGYAGDILEARSVRKELTKISATLQGRHWSTHAYTPGILPDDNVSGTEQDFSRTDPSPATSLAIVVPPSPNPSGTRVGGDGHVTAHTVLAMVLPTDNFLRALVKYKLNGAADWIVGTEINVGGAATARIEGLLPATRYDYTVSVHNAFGRVSSTLLDPVLTNQQTLTDASVPVAPTGLACGSYLKGNLITWTSIAEADVRSGGAIRVWRGTTNNATAPPTTEQPNLRVAGDSHAIWDTTGAYGVRYFYFLRAQDSSGNLSPFSASVNNGVDGAAKVGSDDLGPGSVNTPAIGGGAVNTGNIAPAAVTETFEDAETDQQETTSNSPVDIPGSSLTVTFADGESALVIASIPYVSIEPRPGNGGFLNGFLQLVRGSTILATASIGKDGPSGTTIQWSPVTMVKPDTPGAGTFTYKLRFGQHSVLSKVVVAERSITVMVRRR